MSILQKGGWTVLVGTIFASALILLIGNSATGEVKTELETIIEKAIAPKLESKKDANLTINAMDLGLSTARSKAIDESEKVSPENTDEGVISFQEKTVLPPPGPYIEYKKSSGGKVGTNDMDSFRIPVAPAAPMQKKVVVSKKPTEPKIKTLKKGSIPIAPKPLVSPVTTSIEETKSKIVRKLTNALVAISPPKQTILLKPRVDAPVAPKQKILSVKSPAITNSIISPPQPMWMNKAPMLKTISPQKPQRAMWQNNKQQRYIVVPAPMYAPNYNYSYPQMPMYGGVYYAPTYQQQYQQQLLPRVRPMKKSIKIQSESSSDKMPEQGNSK